MPITIIKELNLDTENHKGLWFLCWLGRVINNPIKGTREVTAWFVPIYESKLQYKGNQPIYDAPEALGRIPISRIVGVGDLSFLLIGMVLNSNGKIISFPQDYSNDLRVFTIDDFQEDSYCKKYLHNTIVHGKTDNSPDALLDDKGKPLKIYANYPFPYVANGAPCFTFTQGEFSIIIPKSEIARFSFFSTSRLVNAIFSDKLEDLFWVDEDEILSNSLDKKMIVAKGINKIEAATLANIAFVKEAKNSKDYIFNSIQYLYQLLDKDNEDAPIFFNSNFPFEGKGSIYVLGREVKYEDKKSFLVYEILDTDVRLPYKSIHYDFYVDNRSGENKNDPELETKKTENKRKASLPEDLDAIDTDVTNNPESNTTSLNLELRSGRVNYFNSEKPQIEANDKLLQKYRYDGKTTQFEKKFNSFSTKENGEAGTVVGKVNVVNRSLTSEEVGDYFDKFFLLVESIKKFFDVNYLQIQGFSNDKRISCFPYDTKFTPSISDHLDFCYYNPYDKVKKLRRVAVVELVIENMFFYLMEIDPYGLGNTGLRTATIYTSQLGKIFIDKYPNTLSKLLIETVIYEGNFSRMHEENVFSKAGLNSDRSNHRIDEALSDYTYRHICKIISIVKKEKRIVPYSLEAYIDSKPI